MKYITYGAYIFAPIIAAVWWLAVLLAMILWWSVGDDSRRYRPDEPTIVFISDVGAAHKAFFIVGTSITSTFYVITLCFERYLRHRHRIPNDLPSIHTARYLDITAVIFGSIGALALVLLSIFDAFNHSRAHWSLTLVFVLCIAISAASQTAEVLYLKRKHPDRKTLKWSARMKLVIVGAAILFAICFGALYGGWHASNKRPVGSAAAVFEWAIAFLYDFYLFTFIVDLMGAANTSPRRRGAEDGIDMNGIDMRER